MRAKHLEFALSGMALLVGAVIYGVFRQNTYIGALVANLLHIPPLQQTVSIAFYLPDFLWSFSLTSLLLAVFSPTKKLAALFGIVTSVYGALWELLQYSGAISGTADILDVVLYFTAAWLAVIINHHITKEKAL